MSTERSNLRLMRASEYIQRFNLDIRHKPGKANTVPDALSRLANTALPTNKAELDFTNISHVSAYNYMATLVEIKPEFKQTILDGYTKDVSYCQITDILDSNRARNPEDRNDLPFEKDQEGLIWHLGETRRLCIPNTAKLIGELLEIAHTKHGHPGGDRTFERASSSWYIRGLLKHIRQFLRHCPECLVFQTRRHQPYRSLQPIQSLPVPFHMLTIDFILALPLSKDLLNAVMSITDKFSKCVALVPSKEIYTARMGEQVPGMTVASRLGPAKSYNIRQRPQISLDFLESFV